MRNRISVCLEFWLCERRVGKGRFGSQIAEVLAYRLSFMVHKRQVVAERFYLLPNIIIKTNRKYKSRVNSKSQALLNVLSSFWVCIFF